MQAAGVAGATLSLSGTASAFDTVDPAPTIDDRIDRNTLSPQEVIIVFDSREALEAVDLTDEVDLSGVYWEFEVLPMAFATALGPEIELIAELPGVRYVSDNYELEYHNDDSRVDNGAGAVNAGDGLEAAYTGENTHAVVIDSGVDPNHPGLDIEQNFRYVGAPEANSEPLAWVDAGPADTDGSGHGTHCIGSLAGDGELSGGDDDHTDGEYGQFAGMAPDTTITSYSTGAGGLLLVYIVSAYDHMIAEQRSDSDTEYHVVSNSYGPLEDERDFEPADPNNVATWLAHEAGILPVFSAGNSGPGEATLSQYTKAPHVLGVAATNADQTVTDFSSRGRSTAFEGANNYDRGEAYENLTDLYRGVPEDEIDGPIGIYRNGIGAKGGSVMSSMMPQHFLVATASGQEEGTPLYSAISGTSMSCPTAAGCASLVIDAHIENFGERPEPMEILNLLEATAVADPGTEAETDYSAENMGTGYVDASAAVALVESDELPEFDDVDILDSDRPDELEEDDLPA